MFPNQTRSLTAYVTARLAIEADAQQQAIAAVRNTNVEEAESWDRVREDCQRWDAIKGLLRFMNERGGDIAEPALMWLAAMWAGAAPLADRHGRPYTANAGGLVHLTECCMATPTFSGSALCCRSCYRNIESDLVIVPEVSPSDTIWRGQRTARQPIVETDPLASAEARPATPETELGIPVPPLPPGQR